MIHYFSINKKVTSVALSSDGRRVLTCGRDDALRIVDIASFDTLRTFADPDFHVGLNWCQVANFFN